jgi:hypothetical protein
MKVSLMRSYRSKNGNATFVYKVAGNSTDLEAFKAAQGDYYREDENGSPLWFTTRCIGNNGKLIITTNGNVVPDMSAFDQAASLASQYGGNFGAELARAAASQLVGNQGGSSAISTPSKEEVADESDADMGDL